MAIRAKRTIPLAFRIYACSFRSDGLQTQHSHLNREKHYTKRVQEKAWPVVAGFEIPQFYCARCHDGWNMHTGIWGGE